MYSFRVGARERLRDAVAAMLGISAYAAPVASGAHGPELDDASVKEIRKSAGGSLQPLIATRLRWYLADLESAQISADAGQLRPAAQLYRAMRRDGVLAGLLGTRTSGLVRLPKRFYGSEEIAASLRAKNGSRSVFDEMLPASELAALAADGIALGVGVGELVPVVGRDYPVLVRLDPEFLQYIWNENRWYFLSIAGRIPITPGDGRWVLHIPGARMAPWTFGLWPALGRSFINKEHAMTHRANYSAKLANPARVAVAPIGATEPQRKGFLQSVIRWGINTVFELPIGWEVKLIESNGRGFDVFQREIDTSDNEMMVSLAGQVVTTTGGSGFISADLFKTIRQDLIKSDADALAFTVNTQALPAYIAGRYGYEAVIDQSTIVEWDADEPKDRAAEAQTMLTVAAMIKALGEALAPYARALNVQEITTRFGIPVVGDPTSSGAAGPSEMPAPVSTPALEPAPASDGSGGDGTDGDDEEEEEEQAA